MTDYTSALYGEHALHVPAWLYVQNQGPDIVSFVGASRIEGVGAGHPLRYGSERTHQLIIGEMIIRPRLALGTDALRGEGLGQLVTHPAGGPEQLTASGVGEWIIL
jgi:hypothetical protein